MTIPAVISAGVPAAIPNDEMQRLAALVRSQLLDTPIEERFERVVRLACRILDVPIAAFTLVDESRQWFKAVQGLSSLEAPREISFCAHTILGDEIFVVPDARKDVRFANNPMVTTDPQLNFYAGCPVHAPDGYKIGTLCVADTRPRDLSVDHAHVLRDLGAIIETELGINVLSSAQVGLISELDSANRRSLVDPLTNLWNREGITTLFKRSWADATRNEEPITAVLVDIDHFKKVNDTYGHPEGDEVIRCVARCLLAALRTEDAVGRIGGEEFLVLLPRTGMQQAIPVTERLRRDIENLEITLADGTTLRMTASFGFASTLPAAPQETGPEIAGVERLIKQADTALYTAKNAGRNRVAAASGKQAPVIVTKATR